MSLSILNDPLFPYANSRSVSPFSFTRLGTPKVFGTVSSLQWNLRIWFSGCCFDRVLLRITQKGSIIKWTYKKKLNLKICPFNTLYNTVNWTLKSFVLGNACLLRSARVRIRQKWNWCPRMANLLTYYHLAWQIQLLFCWDKYDWNLLKIDHTLPRCSTICAYPMSVTWTLSLAIIQLSPSFGV